MGVSPQDCVVLEDAPAGVEAALTANMKVVGLGHASELQKAHLVLDNAKNLSLGQLNQIKIENIKKEDDKSEMVLERTSPTLDNSFEDRSEEIKSPETLINEEPKHGRNEIVKITNGHEVKDIKYKKAKSLIETGEWKIV